MLKKILSKDTKTIVLSLIPIVFSLFIMMDKTAGAILLGGTILISTIFYLFTDNILSPILLCVTLLATIIISNYLLLNLTYQYINYLSSILFLELFIYFATLTLGYYFTNKERGLFILAFIIAMIFLIISYALLSYSLIPVNKVRIFEVMFAIMLVVLAFVVLRIRKGGER